MGREAPPTAAAVALQRESGTEIDLIRALFGDMAYATPRIDDPLPVYRRVTDRFIAPARARLGPEASERAAAAGRVMSADEAIAIALEEPARARCNRRLGGWRP